MNYVPLYIKTHYSLLTSMIKIDELVNFAKTNSLKALTITDNNMYGVLEFYKLCVDNNIKPIIGLEITIDNNKIVLYCQNYQGYKNLLKLNTILLEEQLNIKKLQKYNENIICIVPYESLKLYDDLSKIYKYIFKSYKNQTERDLMSDNNLLYMNETLYLYKDDANYIDYLHAIRDGVTIHEVSNNQINYLQLEIPKQDLENNNKIFDLCNLELVFHQKLLPIYETPNNIDSNQYLKKLCINGLRQKFGNEVYRIYIDRLNYELSIISKMGFSNYFLIVWDYVSYAKKNNIMAYARGSSAGSLVAYCLNITNVDPIKYNLLFERFLNPNRVTMPDIDVDFEFDRRDEIIKYCIDKYGPKKVAPIITFGTLGAKQVIRDVGRIMRIDLKIIDSIAKMLDPQLSLKDNYNKNNKLKKFLNKNNNLMLMYKISSKFEGLKRHSSVHAAGLIIANTDLDNVIPLDKKQTEFYTTGYAMDYLEDLGLLKMDILGLKNFTIINNIIKDINNDLKISLTFDNIPLDNSKTFDVFAYSNTVGIFQFESEGMKQFLRKLKPNNIEDLIAANALYRPGPMANIDTYISRKQGREEINYFHSTLEHILKPTYGIIIYQEQIMQIASVMAGFTLGEADILRRAIVKKDENVLLKEREHFSTQSIGRGYQIDIVNEVFDLILKFAQYGFPRAHSTAYAIVAYKIAYLKANYSKYFMKNLLSMVIGSTVKTKEYIYDCKSNNVLIYSPSINKSANNYLIYEDGIIYPLSAIKNISINAINLIIEERKNGQYIDIFDFVKRVYGKVVNQNIIEVLINAGCFNEFGYTKRTLHENLDLIINYGELVKGITGDYALEPAIKEYAEYSTKEMLAFELEVFGFYLSEHPVSEYKRKYSNKINISDIARYFNQNIEIIIYTERIKEITTKNNQLMCFITGADESNIIDIVVFPKVYERVKDVKLYDILKIKGRVEKRFDKFNIVANKIEKIE